MLWSIRLQCQTWLRNWTTKFILSPPLSFYILLFNILFWNNYQFTRSYKDSTERTEVSFTQFSMVTSYIIKVQYQKHWHWYNMSIVFCLFSVIHAWRKTKVTIACMQCERTLDALWQTFYQNERLCQQWEFLSLLVVTLCVAHLEVQHH